MDFNVQAKKEFEDKPKLSLIPPIILKYIANPEYGVVTTKNIYDIILNCISDDKSVQLSNIEVSIAILYTVWESGEYEEELINELTKVAEMGANKYGKYNWRKGSNCSFYLDACIRHILAMEEEWLDKESNLPHICHAIINLGIIHYFISNDIGINDIKPE